MLIVFLVMMVNSIKLFNLLEIISNKYNWIFRPYFKKIDWWRFVSPDQKSTGSDSLPVKIASVNRFATVIAT